MKQKRSRYLNLFTFIVSASSLLSACNIQEADPNQTPHWWKEAVVYQIYPRSYADSNGDGIGDLRGIIDHLDYIKSLGVDAVWLNPIFSSPNDDNGYDVSDFTAIMEEFGTLTDFEELVAGLHQRNIRLILDLVANHSSDEHRWFQQSRLSRDNPYRNYYHWWPAEKGIPAHRHSDMDPDLSAWAYDSLTDSYYLHLFSRKQPDLNWENPALRQDFYQDMRFWLDRGIDGFRIDVASYISKDTLFPEIDFEKYQSFGDYYCHGPHVHEYLHEMNSEVLSKYDDIMTVGEGNPWINTLDFTDARRNEFSMFYVNANDVVPKQMPDGSPLVSSEVKMQALRNFYTQQDSLLRDSGWPTVILGNHDLPRMQSYWGDDTTPESARLSSQALITFLMTMRGTVFFYGGDEIGMQNIRFTDIADYNDIVTKSNYANKLKNEGYESAQDYLEQQQREGRDNARTPMQWNATDQAGFTSSLHPWLKVNPNYLSGINVEAENQEPSSILNFYRQSIALRHDKKQTLVYGKYQLIDPDNERIYSYLRTNKETGEQLIIAINFSSSDAVLDLGELTINSLHNLLSNYPDSPQITGNNELKLQPWQAFVSVCN